MSRARSSIASGLLCGLVFATVAHAGGELELVAAQADVPIGVGEFADVQVTVRNRTAETMSDLVLRVGPAYRYEQRSAPDCGPLVPEIMTPARLRSSLAPIAAFGERTCIIRVHRDAGMATSPSEGWEVFPGGSPAGPLGSVWMRFGTFAELGLSATLLSRSVSSAGIHSVVRVALRNDSDLELAGESALDPCLSAREQRVIAGSCTVAEDACIWGIDNFLRWPVLPPGETVHCDLESTIPLTAYTGSPRIYTSHVTIGTTGEMVHPSIGVPPLVAFPIAHAQVALDQEGVGGTWANAATPAQGLVLDVSADFYGEGRALLFGGWFTYGAGSDDVQRWYTLQGEVQGNEGEVGVYYSSGGTFDSGQPTTTTRVGTATVRLADCNHGQLTYDFNAYFEDGLRYDTIPLTRVVPNATCRTDGDGEPAPHPLEALAGTWADASSSSQGLVVDVDPAQRMLFAGWFTYPASGTEAQHWYTLQGTLDVSAPAGTGIGLYESTGGVFNGPEPAATVQVGEVDIELLDCMSASMTYRFTAGDHAGLGGTLDLSRLGAAPASCVALPAR